MGLEAVELIIEIEEYFQVQISDLEFANIYTVGDLHICLVDRLKSEKQDKFTESDAQSIWQQVCRIVAYVACVEPEELSSETSFYKDLRF